MEKTEVLKMIFFPGSDDELGFLEDEDEEHHDENPRMQLGGLTLTKVLIILLYLF